MQFYKIPEIQQFNFHVYFNNRSTYPLILKLLLIRNIVFRNNTKEERNESENGIMPDCFSLFI